MKNNEEVLLSIEHLCQYFRLNHKDFKAVDDVSFNIKKGEVFGLVGESGCGKTTTGRSIIKLYNITSGNIYFKGIRIGAGIRSYKDEIASLKAKLKKLKNQLKNNEISGDEFYREYEGIIKKIDFEEQPPMFKISDTHYAATWLLDPRAPKVEMPKIIKERIERMKQKHSLGGNSDEK